MNKIILYVSSVVMLVLIAFFMLIRNQTSPNQGHVVIEGPELFDGIGEAMDQQQKDLEKIKKAYIHIPEINLEGSLYGSTSSYVHGKDIYQIHFQQHFLFPEVVFHTTRAHTITVLKNDEATSTYLILFDEALARVIAYSKISKTDLNGVSIFERTMDGKKQSIVKIHYDSPFKEGRYMVGGGSKNFEKEYVINNDNHLVEYYNPMYMGYYCGISNEGNPIRCK